MITHHNLVRLPRSNMHGRKRPFTVKNGDIRRSYTGSVHGHHIRSETDTVYGDRIKIWSDLKVTVCTPYTELYDCRIRSFIIVCGRIRLQYASLFRFTLEVSEYINSKYF